MKITYGSLCWIAFMSSVLAVLCLWIGLGERTIYRTWSVVNGEVIVIEGRGLRVLRFSDGSTQTVIRPGRPDELFAPYYRVAVGGLRFARETADRFLVVGMGGGAIPQYLQVALGRPVGVDSVEYDPVVAKVAVEFFGLRPSATQRVHVEDGAAFVARVEEPYDFIVLDAFGGLEYPPHMVTAEFFQVVKKALRSDGVVAANLLAAALNPKYEEMLQTFAGVFPVVWVERVTGGKQVIMFGMKERYADMR